MMARTEAIEESADAARPNPAHEVAYALSLEGFPQHDRARAAERMALAFGIDAEQAGEYLDEAPVTVLSHVDEDRIELYVRELHRIGAELKVTRWGGPTWTIISTPDGESLNDDDLFPWRGARIEDTEGVPLIPPSPFHATPTGAGTAPEVALEDLIDEELAADDDEPLPAYVLDEAWPVEDDAEPSGPAVQLARQLRLTGEMPAWLERQPTAEFFLKGLRPRRAARERRALQRQRSKEKRARHARFRHDGEDVSAWRLPAIGRLPVGKIRQGVIYAAGLAAVVFGLLQLWEPPIELTHDIPNGQMSVELPSGYADMENRSGTLDVMLGQLPYDAYSVRKRGEAVGSLLFNHIELPSSTRDRWSTDDIYIGAVAAAVDAHGGELVTHERVEQQGFRGVEGRYDVSRLENRYRGRVRVLDIRGSLALLACEGVGDACWNDDRASDFFDSFEVDDD